MMISARFHNCRIRAVLFFLTLLMTTTAGRAAHADEDPEVLIRQGVNLRKTGDDAKAHGYFRRAYDIAHTPRSAAQLGLVEYALAFWNESEGHLAEALSAAEDAWIRANQAILEKVLSDVRTHLCEAKITGSPVAARVTVGGRFRGNLPLSVYASPGTAAVEVQATDYQTVRETIVFVPGKPATLVIHLSPLPQVAARAAPQPPGETNADVGRTGREHDVPSASGRSHTWMRPAAWASGGVATLLLAGGILATVASDSNYQDFNRPKLASGENRCSTGLAGKGGADCAASLSAGDRDKNLAIVAFVGTAVFSAASVVLFVTSASAEKSNDSQQAMACSPLIGSASGATCAFRF
jgi:hypothetical protein